MIARRVVTLLAAGFVTVIVGITGCYLAYVRHVGDLRVVEPGVAYISGSLDRGVLQNAVLLDGLRTVLDVGTNRASPGEMSIIDGYGLRYVRFPVPSDDALPRDRVDGLAEILSEVPRPLLIRCSDGAGRARLASAVFQIAVMGRTPEQAWQSTADVLTGFPFFGGGSAGRSPSLDRLFAHWRTTDNGGVR